MSHLWGGRFEERQDQFFSEFNASFRFDQRLVFCDIEGSRAYAKGLLDVGVLSADEESSLQTGLNQIESKLHNNPDFLKSAVHEGSYEDVHAFVEAELFKLCGDAAKKLHTGRFIDLVKGVKNYACHSSFMVFIGSVNIKKL